MQQLYSVVVTKKNTVHVVPGNWTNRSNHPDLCSIHCLQVCTVLKYAEEVADDIRYALARKELVDSQD